MARRAHRIQVTVLPAELGTIRARARMHGVSMAAYIRATALSQPTYGPGDADGWWDTLDQGRKQQVMRWLTDPKRRAQPIPGQIAGFTDEDPP